MPTLPDLTVTLTALLSNSPRPPLETPSPANTPLASALINAVSSAPPTEKLTSHTPLMEFVKYRPCPMHQHVTARLRQCRKQ